jgi:hypothetical protein
MLTNHLIHLNNDPMVKNMFLKNGSERFKPSHLHFKFVA